MSSQSLDVLILGAGVAGCTAALAIKQLDADLNILIVDRKSAAFNISNEEVRIGETLPPHAATRLRELGLWEGFQQANFQRSYGTSAAWGTDELYHNEFIASPYGYGWHIDRNKFDQLLINKCIQEGIQFRFETSFTNKTKVQEGWEVGLLCNKKEINLECKFLVDSTGKKAFLASKFGAKKIKSDQLIGISKAYESTNHELSGSGAMVESVSNGWWYSSKLEDNSAILCFMTDADISKKESLIDEQNFEYQLSKTKYTKLRVGKSISDMQVKAAHTQILDRITSDGWLAVGDSASSYDPLSALGVFKALNMSKYASFAIMDYLKNNKIGLHRYEKIIRSEFNSFLAKKDDYYCEEKRFMDEPFWSRRRAHFEVQIQRRPNLVS